MSTALQQVVQQKEPLTTLSCTTQGCIVTSQVHPGGATIPCVKLRLQNVLQSHTHTHKKEPESRSWSGKEQTTSQQETVCLLFFLCARSLGVISIELLGYFVRCSNASHKACVTTACTLTASSTLFTRDVTVAHLRPCEIH